MSLNLGPSSSARLRFALPAMLGSGRIAAPRPPSPPPQIPSHSHPTVPRCPVSLLQKRQLGSKCSLSSCPRPVPGPPRRTKEAFHQQLPHHPPRRGSQGRTDRKLALPCGGLRQQQIRHVGARNQQNQRHHRKQRLQRCPGIPLYYRSPL